jgi:hypothetical protein
MRGNMVGFLKVLVLFLMIAFVPSLRSCANVSYGFPSVIFEASDPFTVTTFHPWNLALNVVVLAALFIALYFLVFRRIRDNRKIGEGLKYLYIFNGLEYVGFWGVYWLISSKSDVVGAIVMVYSVLLYGPFFLLNDIGVFSAISRESALFGDEYDIKIRLVYVFMSTVWFAIGCVKQVVVEKIRARKET